MATARRLFGRFDAALNISAVHNAKLYLDGAPARGAGRPIWRAKGSLRPLQLSYIVSNLPVSGSTTWIEPLL